MTDFRRFMLWLGIVMNLIAIGLGFFALVVGAKPLWDFILITGILNPACVGICIAELRK